MLSLQCQCPNLLPPTFCQTRHEASSLWSAASFAMACSMAARGFKKGSLSWSGALAAVGIGTITMSAGLSYGLTLIFFYLSSSKLTRLMSHRKAQFLAGHSEGGQRNAAQVLANSAVAALAAMLAAQNIHSRWWLGAFLGHYACVCADTWASEVGVLAHHPPRLITTLHKVPPGTNGGVSGLGLAASLAGGVAIVLVYAASDSLQCAALPFTVSMVNDMFDDLRLSHIKLVFVDMTAFATVVAQPSLRALIALGSLCGLGGSLLDSLLGATLQYSGLLPYAPVDSSAFPAADQMQQPLLPNQLQSSKTDASIAQSSRASSARPDAPGVMGQGRVVNKAMPQALHISGWDVLSNDMVNFLSSLAAALAGAVCLTHLA